MSFYRRMQGTVDRIAKHFGDGAEITMRRHHTLYNGLTGAAVTTLAVNGMASAGASSLDLDGTNLEEGGLLPVGITFTIAGDATTYTVATSDVRVDSSGELGSVAITPVLAAEAADDAVVTLATTYTEYTFPCARRRYYEDERGEGVAVDDWRFIVSTLGAEVEFSRENDSAVFDGQNLVVKAIEPYEPGTSRAGLILQVAA